MASKNNNAYLALGSNINAEHNLPAAVKLLAEYGEVVRLSKVWESTPVGFIEQNNFLNAVLLLKTTDSIETIRKQIIPEVEKQLKRVRDPLNKNGPRTIDVDLVLFNNETIEEEDITLPDPDILTRPFLIVPLAEIDPDYLHPLAKKSLQAIAKDVASASKVMQQRPDVALDSHLT